MPEHSLENIKDIKQSKERTRLIIVFGVFLLLMSFIFRDFLFNIVPLMRGDSVIAREELVPFFDFQTQFLDQMKFGESSLTNTDEIRVSYSSWTSWLRYSKILPFAIIVLNTLSAFTFFISIYIIGRRLFYNISKNKLIIFSFLSSTFIFLILLYSKITHFYTLIFGFSLFSLAISLSLLNIFFRTSKERKLNVAIGLLVLLNPAIHYHVLYYFVLCILAPLSFFYDKIKHQDNFPRYVRVVVYNIFISVIPYSIFILFVLGGDTDSVSNSISVNYSTIFYSSNYIKHLYSFDISAQADMFFHGDYLINNPRYLKMFFAGLLVVPLFYKKTTLLKDREPFLIVSYFIFIVSLWMSIGYTHILSFHSLGSELMLYLYDKTFLGLKLFKQLVGTIIQILRFPHRFEFILFYISPILMLFSLAILNSKIKKIFFWSICLLVFVVPFVIDTDYRKMITTGDFNGFLKPYPIPEDLKEIKKIIVNDPGLGIVLPTMESGREIVVGDSTYSFLDKLFIYYINTPFIYYGTGADLNNKIESFLVYQSVLYNQNWWQGILANALQVKYILVPHTENRQLGNTYLPDVDEALIENLDASDTYSKVYEGKYLSLYKLNTQILHNKDVLLDASVKYYDTEFKTDLLKNSNIYLLPKIKDFLESKNDKYIDTNNPQNAYYDIISNIDSKRAVRVYPDSEIIPFADDFISSSYYVGTPLSQKTLLLSGDSYNYTKRSIYDLINLQSLQFVGVTGIENKINFNFKTTPGKNNLLLLKVISDSDTFTAIVNGKPLNFKRVDGNEDTFSYFYSSYVSDSGKNILKLGNDSDKKNTKPIIAESLLILDKDLAYTNNWAGLSGSDLVQFSYVDGNQYRIKLKND